MDIEGKLDGEGVQWHFFLYFFFFNSSQNTFALNGIYIMQLSIITAWRKKIAYNVGILYVDIIIFSVAEPLSLSNQIPAFTFKGGFLTHGPPGEHKTDFSYLSSRLVHFKLKLYDLRAILDAVSVSKLLK